MFTHRRTKLDTRLSPYIKEIYINRVKDLNVTLKLETTKGKWVKILHDAGTSKDFLRRTSTE